MGEVSKIGAPAESEKKKITCFGCKSPVEMGQCPTCHGYNLPARKGASLFIKETDFNEPTFTKDSGANPGYTFECAGENDDLHWTNIDGESLMLIGNGNPEFGLMLFKFWFQKHKTEYPSGDRPTVKLVRDYLDDVSGNQRWS